MLDDSVQEPLDLPTWLSKRRSSHFPSTAGTPYKQRLTELSNHLAPFHKEVNALAAAVDGGVLTDHGTDHIQTIFLRLGHMLTGPKRNVTISPYELHLLLMAAQIHDVGNAFGRSEHESKLDAILNDIKLVLSDDAAERRLIRRIATAHGGMVNGSRDTIGQQLYRKECILSRDVRPQLLAALLRFADELADDCTRASRFTDLEENGVSPIPIESAIYHRYAKSLHSVRPIRRDRTVHLEFAVSRDHMMEEYGVNGTCRYLLDEIYKRTLKMHRERIYCMRFMHDAVSFERISVRISVFESEASTEPLITPIGYVLREAGYPDDPNDMTKCLADGPLVYPNGAALATELQSLRHMEQSSHAPA